MVRVRTPHSNGRTPSEDRDAELDNKEFQESYARVSRWARRHDKSPEFNYVAPHVDEMTAELALVRAWFDRIKRYANY